LLFA
jgi:hypothetical protein